MIKLNRLKRTCTACPQQWEGETTTGEIVYIRERWNILTVGVGATLQDAVSNNMLRLVENHIPLMDFPELQQRLSGVLDFSDCDYKNYSPAWLDEDEDGFQTHSED